MDSLLNEESQTEKNYTLGRFVLDLANHLGVSTGLLLVLISIVLAAIVHWVNWSFNDQAISEKKYQQRQRIARIAGEAKRPSANKFNRKED